MSGLSIEFEGECPALKDPLEPSKAGNEAKGIPAVLARKEAGVAGWGACRP